jgi:hypothetical protein
MGLMEKPPLFSQLTMDSILENTEGFWESLRVKESEESYLKLISAKLHSLSMKKYLPFINDLPKPNPAHMTATWLSICHILDMMDKYLLLLKVNRCYHNQKFIPAGLYRHWNFL